MGYRSTNTIAVQSAPITVAGLGLQAPEYGVAALALGGSGKPKKIVGQGGRCTVALGGTSSKTRVVAQKGTVALGLRGDAQQTARSVPRSFSHVTITRDYDLATGEAPTGAVYFTPSAWLKNNLVMVAPATVSVALDAEGKISIHLAANNDPDTTPTGSYYTACEEIIGQPRRCYKVILPCDQPTFDLAFLEAIYPAIPTPPSPSGGYGISGYGTSGYGG